MKKTALKVAYIGSDFYGFQRQPNVRTVEGEIIKVLEELEIFENPYDGKFSIAGRTDRGVHSLGNVIAFISEKEIRINQINNHLPEDIQLIAIAPVRYGFKPRYPIRRHYRYYLKDFHDEDLDLKAMENLKELFIGTHDFTNFTKRNQRTPIRTIDEIRINTVIANNNINNNTTINNNISNNTNSDNNISNNSSINNNISNNTTINNNFNNNPNSDNNISNNTNNNNNFNNNNLVDGGNDYKVSIDVFGESFLWNMVRKMMAVFRDVGEWKIQVDEVEKYFDPLFDANIKPLPPENLILMDVEYKDIVFKYDDYALERFQKVLNEKIFDYKKKYSTTTNILSSVNEFFKEEIS
jgi:tRNA pseudouridine38-40 synthase